MPRRPRPLAVHSPVLRGCFGRPTLGGWLTILNCLGWAAFVLHDRAQGPTGPHGLALGVQIVGFLIVSAPLAVWFWLPQLDYTPRLADLVGQSLMAGANAIVWGYGLAWLVRWATHAGDRR